MPFAPIPVTTEDFVAYLTEQFVPKLILKNYFKRQSILIVHSLLSKKDLKNTNKVLVSGILPYKKN